MYVFPRNVINYFAHRNMAIVMKQYLGVREYANGTKQIPVNSITATFVATKPVRIQEKKTAVQREKPK